MSRVLIVNDFEVEGGAETYVQMLMASLDDLGHSSKLFCGSRFNDRSPSIAELTVGRQAAKSLGAVIEEFKPNVVHLNNIYHRFSPLSQLSISSHLLTSKARLLWTLHDGFPLAPQPILTRVGRNRTIEASKWSTLQPFGWDEAVVGSFAKWLRWVAGSTARRRLLEHAHVIVPSIGLSERLQARFPGLNLIHVPNPVDTRFSLTSSHRGRQGFVFVGRICRAKGITTFLEFADKEFLDRLTVVGSFGDKEDEVFCRRVVAERNLETKFTGRLEVSECRKIIAASELAIFPTQGFENASLSLADALVAGTPALIGEMNGLAPQLRNSPDVLVYDSLSPRETLQVTKRILQSCPGSTEPGSLRGCFSSTSDHVGRILEIAGLS